MSACSPTPPPSSSSEAAWAEAPWPGAWPAGASMCLSWSEASTCRASPRTGHRRRSSSRSATSRLRRGSTTQMAPSSALACTTWSAAIPRSTAQACLVFVSATSSRRSTRTASHRPGHSATPTSSLTTLRSRHCSRCTARRVRTRASRGAASRTPIPPSRKRPTSKKRCCACRLRVCIRLRRQSAWIFSPAARAFAAVHATASRVGSARNPMPRPVPSARPS